VRTFLVAGHRERSRRITRIATVSGWARGLKEPERRVFVVDDDQSVRKSLATLLSTEDYAIETFASAVEALHPAAQMARNHASTAQPAMAPRYHSPRFHIQIKAACCLFVTVGVTYAFLRDKETEPRSQSKARDREDRPNGIVAFRFSRDCLASAGFKRNHGGLPNPN
jgi:CheY-like chemotaxis protein